MALKSTNSLPRRTSLLVRGSSINEKEQEFDWRDRLRQWKQVGQSSGAVTSFADKQVESYQSCAFSVLGVLQADVNSDQLQKRVEESLVQGLRRSAGLHLLNFAMNLSYSSTRFLDLVQWLQGSLRSNLVQVQHYLTGLEGCGIKAESGIQDQFIKILKRITDVLKNEPLDGAEEYVHLINTLCWDFTVEDQKALMQLNIFEVLLQGNGDQLHPLYRAWGREKNHFQIELNREEKFSLAARLRQTFEFLTQNVIERVFVDKQQEKIEIGSEASPTKIFARKAAKDGTTSAQALA